MTRYLTIIAAALVCAVGFASCSDDEGVQRSEYDIVGLWSDREGHFLEFESPERMYEYAFFSEPDMDYWFRHRQMYFYEPYGNLMAKQDMAGVMQMYKIIGLDGDTLVICWVATPDLGSPDDNKYDFLKMFFDKTYVADPARYETYRRVTDRDLAVALDGYELYEN